MPQTFWQWVTYIIHEYSPLFLTGVKNTMIIAITGTVFGFLIGMVVALIKTIETAPGDNVVKRATVKLMQLLMNVYIEVFRGTPMIVQAMVIYYGLFQNVSVDKIVAAIFIVSINTGSYMAEIIRGGIISVDPGQMEGALSIGMTHAQSMLYVIFPQATRNIMPSIGNEFVINIKDSSVLSVISVFELFFAGKSAAGTYLKYFEVFFIIAAIYFVLTFTVTRLLRILEKKMDGPDTYVIMGSQSDSRSTIRVQMEAKGNE